MASFVGFEDGFSFAVWNRICVDIVAVKVVQNEEISISLTGGDFEFAGLV